MTDKKTILLLFLAALTLRLLYLLEMADGPYFTSPQLDELYHDLWAQRIAAGDLLGDQVFFRAPLYPYFLGACRALFGPDYFLPRLLQVLFGAASAVLLYLLGKRAFPHPIPLLAAALAAAWPTSIFFDGELLIPTLILPLNLATLLLLLLWRDHPQRLAPLAAAGLLCGLSAIARPNILLVCPFFAFWAAWIASREGKIGRGGVLARMALLTAAVLLPILPITARNAIIGHDHVLISSQAGINFYIGNKPTANGYTASTPRHFTFAGKYEDSVELYARRQAQIETGRDDLLPSEVSRHWSAKAWKTIAQEPGRVARLTLKKAILFWSNTEIRNNKYPPFVARFSTLLWILLHLLPFGLIAPPALARIFSQKPTPPQVLLAGYLLFYTLSVIPFFVCARYRMPILPILLLFAAAYITERVGERRKRNHQALVKKLLILAPFALLVWVDFYGIRAAMKAHHPDDLWVAGNGYLLSGRLDKAEEYYREALGERPEFPKALLNLGKTLFRKGDLEASRTAFEKLLALEPENVSAIGNLGVLALDQADSLGAEDLWRRALEIHPDHQPSLAALGELLRESGQLEEALPLLEKAFVLNPQALDSALSLIRLYQTQNNQAKQEEWINKALKINPQRTQEKLQEWGIRQ